MLHWLANGHSCVCIHYVSWHLPKWNVFCNVSCEGKYLSLSLSFSHLYEYFYIYIWYKLTYTQLQFVDRFLPDFPSSEVQCSHSLYKVECISFALPSLIREKGYPLPLSLSLSLSLSGNICLVHKKNVTALEHPLDLDTWLSLIILKRALVGYSGSNCQKFY